MKTSELLLTLDTAYRARTPLMIWCKPASGLIATLKEFAKSGELQFTDIRAGQIESFSTELFPRDGSGILLFDELDAASRSFKENLYQFVRDRGHGNYVLPEEWLVLGVGNQNKRDDPSAKHLPLDHLLLQLTYEPHTVSRIDA